MDRNDWKEVLFRGMSCIVYEGRPKEMPTGWKFHAMRHGENDWALPISIEAYVLVNFWGLIGMPETYALPDGGLILKRKERYALAGIEY